MRGHETLTGHPAREGPSCGGGGGDKHHQSATRRGPPGTPGARRETGRGPEPGPMIQGCS
eukprot:8358214-Pyramimonas_sp.AAC.1